MKEETKVMVIDALKDIALEVVNAVGQTLVKVAGDIQAKNK